MTHRPASGPWVRVERLLSFFENVAAIVAAIMLLAAMALVSADAIMRYFFVAPLTFQYTLTEKYLLVGLVCLALPWGYRTGGYIRIEAFSGRLGPGVRAGLLRVGLGASAIYIAVLAWAGGKHFWGAWVNNEVQLGTIDWPIAWSWIWVPIGCGLLSLRLALQSVGPSGQLHTDHVDERAS